MQTIGTPLEGFTAKLNFLKAAIKRAYALGILGQLPYQAGGIHQKV